MEEKLQLNVECLLKRWPNYLKACVLNVIYRKMHSARNHSRKLSEWYKRYWRRGEHAGGSPGGAEVAKVEEEVVEVVCAKVVVVEVQVLVV